MKNPSTRAPRKRETQGSSERGGTMVAPGAHPRRESDAPSARRLEHLVATYAADLLTVHAPDGRCLYASGETSALLGRRPDALRGRRIQEFITGADLARVDEELFRLDGPETRRVRYRIQATDGSSRWVETRVRKSCDLLIATTRDIENEINEEAAEWARLKLEARTDCLTGLQNRWGLEEVLERELDRSRRTGHLFSIALLDVDGLKEINDRNGHGFGDSVLRRIATVIGGACRTYDVLGRWGGDEFLLILPDTGVEEAHGVADRMIATVAGESMDTSDRVRWTLSAGIADSGGSPTLTSIVERADRALYRAKALGGNRVVNFDSEEGSGAPAAEPDEVRS